MSASSDERMLLEQYRACLGISLGASTEELRSAYRRAALATHPDKGGSAASFLQVVQAYEVLSELDNQKCCSYAWAGACRRDTASTVPTVHKVHVTSSTESVHKVKSDKRKRKKEPASYFNDDACDAKLGTILDRLFRVIKASPICERRTLLNSLTDAVREALLEHFEAGAATNAPPGGKNANGRVTGLAGDNSSSESEALLALPAAPRILRPPSRSSTRIRGISVRSFRGEVPLYTADVGFRSFHVRSTATQDLRLAVDCHILLLAGKQAVLQELATSSATFEQAVCCHFKTLSSTLDLRFFCQLHTHRLIGRKLYTPETLDVDAALEARSQLMIAMDQGWSSLREVWVAVQLKYGWQGGHRGMGRVARGRDELEAIVQEWEKIDAVRQRISALRSAQRAERAASLATKEAEQLERARLKKADQVYRLGLHYVWTLQAHKRRSAHRRLMIARKRLAWHRRRDLTMEDILRGPPL